MAGMTASASQPRERTERRIIERPRLIKLLDETEARTILLLAPAGYGKTTLARQWAKTLNGAVWVTLTPAHRDIAVIATDVTRSAGTGFVAGAFVERYLKAHSNLQRKPREVALVVSDHLRKSRVQWLIFDDYQEIVTEPEAEEFVAVLNAELDARFLIASRTRPKWATARLAVYGDISEVDRAALSLDPEESKTLIGRRPQLDDLVAKANGWPAVVGLAAIAPVIRLPGGQLTSALLHDYLAEEVFKAAPKHLQTQLVRLALAPDLTQETLASTFGQAATDFVTEAYELGFLTSAGDGFELHPLVREFLLQKVSGLPRSSHLVRDSIDACVSHKRWDRAFELILRFDRYDLVESVLEAGYIPLMSSGQLATLGNFAARIRATAACPPAATDLAEADVAFADGVYMLASRIASRAASRLPTGHHLMSRAHMIRAQSEYALGHALKAEAEYRSAYETATCDRDKIEALRGLALASLQGEKPLAPWVMEVLEQRRTESPLALVRHIILELIQLHSTVGYRDARSLVAEAEAVVPRVEDPRVRSSFFYVVAYVHGLTANYEAALDWQKLCDEEIASFDLDFAKPHSQWNNAFLALGLRKFGHSERILQRLEDSIAEGSVDYHVLNARILRARLAVETGKPREAVELLPSLRREDVIASVEGEYHATRALALAVCGKRDAALTDAAKADEITSAVEVRVLVAAVRAIAEDNARRNKLAVEMWELAETLEAWDPLIAATRASSPLAETLASIETLRTPLARLFQRSNDLGLARRLGLRARAAGKPTDLLSPREAEILELMARGYRNQDIAKALVLSPSTVKVHVRHIYEKLGVRTRSEAVARLTSLE